jgi:acyl-CoA dehydrogenase
MSILTTVLLFAIGATLLAYFSASLVISAIASACFLVAFLLFGVPSLIVSILLIVPTVILGLLSQDSIRKNWVTAPLFTWYKKVLPSVSDTEQVAIDAGTVWWEGEIFKGNPEWEVLLNSGEVKLTDEEQTFLDGPVEELCNMVNAWEISFKHANIPDDIVDFIKKNKFLGMIIPKEYGGMELSPVAQVAVLTKIFSIGSVVGNFISVPNSLGPGELLVKYGTEDQKKHYLPRLANGEELPCFALTAPLAGSDATSIPDIGTVCKGEWQGKQITGMRLDINKRYITLAPVASLIGLAFKLKDPDHLIGEQEDYGITCALIPRDTKGLEIGRRHYPIGDPFLNGPIKGKDIFVPLDFIIGGKEMAGQGWRMLIECLSTGRAISLPTISNCIAKNTLASTGAYCRIRRQFGLPIAEFEGVQKPLARMAGYSYIIQAATMQTAKAISAGAKPAVPASILKYHCTEMARTAIIDGMDIQGGKAVMKGPKNMLSAAYESVPVAITVEGANIMTRSLMIFGQGAIRCHPYVLKEMLLSSREDEGAVEEFDQLLFAHAGNSFRNSAHAFIDALTCSIFNNVNAGPATKKYFRHATRLSAAFAVTADVAMLTMQASLKKREMISARLGDLLSSLYLVSMVLKQYQDQGSPKDLLPIVDWSCQYLFHQYQNAMIELLKNFPNRFAAWKLKFIVFPLGGNYYMPDDKLEMQIANLVTHSTKTRERLIEGIYLTPNDNNQIGKLNSLLSMADELEPLITKIRKASKQGTLPDVIGMELIDIADEKNVITKEEAQQLREYDNKIMEIINVDDFGFDEFSRLDKK